MNEPKALKVEREIVNLVAKYPEIWMIVSKDMRPELRMVKIEISIKVDDKSE